MSQTAVFPRGTQQIMEILLKQATSVPEFKRIQTVLMGCQGISSSVTAHLVGYCPEHVRLVWRRYRKEGEGFLLGEQRGQVRGKAFLSLEEERRFLAPFLQKANAAGILIVSEVHREYERRYGKRVYPSVIYNLLHRHGWRKIVPRPSHPKGDAEARETYKALVFPPADDQS